METSQKIMKLLFLLIIMSNLVWSQQVIINKQQVELSNKPTNQTAPSSRPQASLASVRNKWRQLELALGSSLTQKASQLELTFKQLADFEGRTAISGGCRQALGELSEALADQRLWASRLLDASARLPAGLLEGTLTELGHFDECLAVRQPEATATGSRGQYCSLIVRPALLSRPAFHTVCQRLPAVTGNASGAIRPLAKNAHRLYYAGLRLGLCTPSKCSPSDVQFLLTAYLRKFELLGQVKSCQIDEDHVTFEDWQKYIIVSFSALILLICIATILDQEKEDTKNKRDHKTTKSCQKYQLYSATLISLSTQQNPLNSHENFSQTETINSQDQATNKFTFQSNPHKQKNQTKANSNNFNNNQLNKNNKYNLIKFVLCFSLKRSLNSIFSQNCAKLPSRSNNSNSINDDIKSIHGIRTLSMIWIIFGHSIGLVSPEMMNNLFNLAELSCSSRLLQAILNATLAVDTFFMISGLVTAVSLIRKCSSVRQILLLGQPKALSNSDLSSSSAVLETGHASSLSSGAWSSETETETDTNSSSVNHLHDHSPTGNHHHTSPSYLITNHSHIQSNSNSNRSLPNEQDDFRPILWLTMRYIRLTPAYLAVIGVSLLMSSAIKSRGPFWRETWSQIETNCKQNWWINLLYLNNFIETDKICLIHSWYLSNDWQFFIVALLLVTLFKKSRQLALFMAIVLFLASSAATFAISYINDFPPTIVATSPATSERWLFIHALYYKPWPHLPPYLIGLFAGYKLALEGELGAQSKRCKRKSVTFWRLLSWLAGALLVGALLNSTYPWNLGLKVEPFLTSLHSALFRSLWAACQAWLIIELAARPSSPLSRLLSWPGFRLTSRLTYSTYLIHPLIIYYHFGSLKERLDSSIYSTFHRFMANLIISYLFALLLALLIEAPSIQLQQTLVGHFGSASLHDNKRRKQQSSNKETNENWISTAHNSTGQLAAWTSAGSLEAAKLECGQRGKQVASSSAGSLTSSAELAELKVTRNQCCSHLDGRQQQQVSSPASGSPPSQCSLVQLDADFQQRLAQAIGRGFRIRNKIANRSRPEAPVVSSRSGLTPKTLLMPADGGGGSETLLEPSRASGSTSVSVSGAMRTPVGVARAAVRHAELSSFLGHQQQQQQQQQPNWPATTKRRSQGHEDH